ncbi:MAG: hypothetical protein ABSF97_00960 [Candidatus Sulfotelmatobacter sp.]|jgi:hypothetical protein
MPGHKNNFLKDGIGLAGFERLGEVLRGVMKNKGPLCAVCQKPVDLRASETNEYGQALHPDCAVRSTHSSAF